MTKLKWDEKNLNELKWALMSSIDLNELLGSLGYLP